MSSAPRVSVIVIFLNAERFLDEAIASVFAQTFTDWELLLVDDGSTDASSAIARGWAEQHSEQVRYLEHAGHVNRGMSASRNLGIRHARGAYVAFLDADDAWFPHALTQQVVLLDTHANAAMVYGPLQWWYSWRAQPDDLQPDFIEELGVLPDALLEPPDLVPVFLLDRGAVPSGFLVRRSVLDQVGGFEDSFRGEYEDQVLCAKICLAFPVFVSSQCWYRYRQHPDSCVAEGLRGGRTRETRLRFLDWLNAYVATHAGAGRAVWWALRFEYWRWKHPTQYWVWMTVQRVATRALARMVPRSRELARIRR